MARKRARYMDMDIQRTIERFALEGYGASQIHRALEQEYAGRDYPSLRTVQNMVRELRPADASGTWSLVEAEPEEAALVLPVLAQVITETRGRIRTITRAEAAIIANIRRACPDLQGDETLYHARLYLARHVNREATDDLDAYLSFAPWRDKRRSEAYRAAVRAGWVEARVGGWVLHDDGTVEGVSGAEAWQMFREAVEQSEQDRGQISPEGARTA